MLDVIQALHKLQCGSHYQRLLVVRAVISFRACIFCVCYRKPLLVIIPLSPPY